MTIHNIGTIDDIPVGEGRAYIVDGADVAVFHLADGTLRALAATCPHRGGPLADGLIDQCVVVCPLHGLTYDLSTGAEITAGGESVRTYRVTSAPDGTLEIEVKAVAREDSRNQIFAN